MPAVLALPVGPDGLLPAVVELPAEMAAEAEAFRADREHRGRAGLLEALARPLRTPERLLLVGVGEADEAGWRAAGAAVVRASQRQTAVTLALPALADPVAVRGVAEGALLAAYRYRLVDDPEPPALRRITLAVDDPARYEPALEVARTVAEVTLLARDLVNTPSDTKSPAWFAAQIARAAGRHDGLTVAVRKPAALAGFGGLLAVGAGSTRGPRLVELSWRPRGAKTHVVLVGKGITFDTGGLAVKPRDGMKLMRKDMAGAAAVAAAVLGAAALRLPVRVTALTPLAENMLSGSAYRPGDVIRHYGGATSEIYNTDAEGRVVLADALAYAADRLEPDVLIDVATLTGAARVALGKRTAALFTDNEELAVALDAAAAAAGERIWRMPLADDYREALDSAVADLVNAAESVGGGAVLAALYLREFTGSARDRWAHLDMSAPAWSDAVDGELAKGATGWGVRTLLRYLQHLPAASRAASPLTDSDAT